MRRQLGYVHYDTEAARDAINQLYDNELLLVPNLFLPSVKLAGKERVGSRLRRRYEAPQTSFQRLVESPAADVKRVAELQRQRENLDPFQLSQRIQAQLERIFQLSTDTQGKGDLSGVVTQAERILERRTHSRACATAKAVHGEKDKSKEKDQDKTKKKGKKKRRRVTFLN